MVILWCCITGHGRAFRQIIHGLTAEAIKTAKHLWRKPCLRISFVGGNKFFTPRHSIGAGVLKVYHWDSLKDRRRCDHMVDIKIDTHVAERPRALKIRKRRKTIFWWKLKFKRFDLQLTVFYQEEILCSLSDLVQKNKVKDIHLTSASFILSVSFLINNKNRCIFIHVYMIDDLTSLCLLMQTVWLFDNRQFLVTVSSWKTQILQFAFGRIIFHTLLTKNVFANV